MQELDMSSSAGELFPEAIENNYNSYTDVNMEQSVADPLNTGVESAGVADHALSDKEMNFKALREQVSRFKEEREYWKGQAEALTRTVSKPDPEPQAPVYDALDWDDSKDVRKAFDTLRAENDTLRHEMRDELRAMSTKSKHNDWDSMVTAHVPELTSKNPIFAEMIQKSSNPYEAAYLLAELNARGGQPQGQQQAYQQPMGINGQRAIANSQKPTSLASIGGGGTLNATDYYANMSDADFHKIAARNLANI